jgi:tRNA1Val (adenine37-N6)-methyltransferase
MWDLTHGHLLGGRVRYSQPRTGFRSGIEPVLLAAAVPARAGDHVLEAGTASGAALLCLAARVPGVSGIGVDLDPALCRLARANATANGFSTLSFTAGDILGEAGAGLGEAGARVFDHVFANPPYHRGGTRSPNAAREAAKRSGNGQLDAWISVLAQSVRARGTVTVILPAALLPQCLHAMAAARCGGSVVVPLWPRQQREAKLLIVRAVKDSRGPARLLPGLVLHADEGGFTRGAEAILRDGAALGFGDASGK